MTWDQSLLTVEINTITRGIRPGSCMVLRKDVPTLRSIVTDHYLLDSISASMHAIDCVKRVLLIIATLE